MRTFSICLLSMLLFACGDDDDVGFDTGADSGAADTGPDAVDTGVVDSGTVDSGAADATAQCQAAPDGTAPLAPDPGEPEVPETIDCGAPEIVGEALVRWPYLQSTTQRSVRVAWTTRSPGTGEVRYFVPGETGITVSASAELFTTERTTLAEEFTAHDATVLGLEPNRSYCYEVLHDGEVVARNLTLSTAWDGDARPIRMVVLGDSGSGSAEQHAVRDALMGHEYDLFLHVGDMAYGEGTYAQFQERFFDVYRDLMLTTPVFPVIGNHEMKTGFGEPYRSVYYLFEQALRDREQEHYYSFDYGNVHFVALDSNDSILLPIYITGEDQDDDMFDWLVDDLTRSDADWKIVFMHHPFFSSSERGIRLGHVARFRKLLEELGVDLILAGHDHHYERSHPLRDGCRSAEPDAITEIIAGGSGAGLRTIADGRWHTASAYNTDYSYLSLDLHGCRLRGEARNTDDEVVDAFELNGCD